jgi:hypothetical protein
MRVHIGFWVVVGGLTLTCTVATAQTSAEKTAQKQVENSAETKADAAQLADVGWLIGSWHNADEGAQKYEEHWSAPAGGAMMGMFRLLGNDKLMVYEFLLIEQEETGVYMRLRHYQSRMVDADPAPIRLKLVDHGRNRCAFEKPESDRPMRILYAGQEDGTLQVTVDTQRNGKPAQFVLKFRKK